MLPWGNAVNLPKLTEAPPPGAPSARWAAAMLARRSSCVMPSRKVANAARNASMVMSLAFCISANSVADLIIRQPAVTGSASTKSAPASSFFTPL